MRLVKNTLYSAAGAGVPLLVTIITLPMLIAEIGLERYGGLAIAWLFLGYFTSADFGIGRAVTQRVASIGKADKDARAAVVWTGLITLLGLSLLLSAGLYIAASWYFSGLFQAGEDVRTELEASVWMLALSAPILGLFGVLSGALMGVECFARVSISAIISNTSMQLLPLVAAIWFGPDLRLLIAAALFAKLAGILLLVLPVVRLFLLGRSLAFSVAEARVLGQFGSWVFVSVLVGMLIVYLDRLTIGAVAGALAAAAYVIPFQIANRTMLVPFAFSQALFPRLASDDAALAVSRGKDATVLNMAVYTPITILLIVNAEPLLVLWLGAELDPRSILVGQIVMTGCWLNAASTVAFSFLQARGQPKFAAVLHLIELPVYAGLLLALGAKFGLAGFAAAFALRCGADSLVILARSRVLDRGALVKIMILGITVLFAFVAAQLFDDWSRLAMAGIALAALSISLARQFLPDTVKAAFRNNPVWGKSRVVRWLI